MKNGDAYSKKFGGVSGNDPDYFKLKIWGLSQSKTLTDTIEFYLADYRFSDNSKDYIVNNWRWIDLQQLGYVTKLYFSVESTDIGMFGINTPAYFCIDNLTIDKQNESNSTSKFDIADISIFPNPCTDYVVVDCIEGSFVAIYDVYGKKVNEFTAITKQTVIPTAYLNNGCYIISVTNKDGKYSSKFIKN